ncbi:MAG: hypothetical protein WBZ36_04620 [Candidatus Nitrosopolaris sp.]
MYKKIAVEVCPKLKEEDSYNWRPHNLTCFITCGQTSFTAPVFVVYCTYSIAGAASEKLRKLSFTSLIPSASY